MNTAKATAGEPVKRILQNKFTTPLERLSQRFGGDPVEILGGGSEPVPAASGVLSPLL